MFATGFGALFFGGFEGSGPIHSTAKARTAKLFIAHWTALVAERNLRQPPGWLPLQVEIHAAAAVRPAHVRDRHEERRRQPIELADLARQERRVAAEAHRTDARLVRFLDDALLERGELRVLVRVVEEAQELFFREAISAAAVTADADAEDAGAAALSLRVQHAVEDGVLDALEIAVAEVGGRERVLRVHVLAATALEHQLHLDVRLAPLVEVKRRRARPGVVAGVPAGDAVDAVLPQESLLRRRAHGLGGDLLELDLVVAGRRVDVEEDGSGVLAERQRVVARQADVAADDVQRHVRVRPLGLGLARRRDGADDVVRQDGGRAANELEDRFEERGLR